jgi:hypothetical protein
MDYSSFANAVLIVVGGSAGGAATVTFLARYLGDRWLGHVLEKEKAAYQEELTKLTARFTRELEHYRAQLDRSIFVSRTHFETEYTAMKEVSQCLSEVKVFFRKLHPIEAFTEPTGTDRTKAIDSMEKAIGKFQEKLEEWAVFLEIAIYNEFNHCHGEATVELRRLKANSEREPNTKYFWDSYQKACQLVRDRIKTLAVLPRTDTA